MVASARVSLYLLKQVNIVRTDPELSLISIFEIFLRTGRGFHRYCDFRSQRQFSRPSERSTSEVHLSEKTHHPASQTHGSAHADLAFVDAAIDMYKAALMKPEGISAEAVPTKVEPDCWVDVAAAVAVLAYHAYMHLMPDRDPALSHFKNDEIGSKVSLSEMIKRRNRIAAALGQKEISQ
jgi:hypothetical protein